MARTYRRDSGGRFSSGGSLAARSSARRSQQKLAGAAAAGKSAASIRAQKGAVTRTTKAAKAARVANQRRVKGKRSNTVAKPKGLKPGALQARRSATAMKRRPPAAVRALASAAAATFVAGQAARARVNRALGGRKRRTA
jgi:hypothetical protein